MLSRKLKAAALTILGMGAFAGSAHAAVIDTDSVRLTAKSVDFGGSVWGIGSPIGSGDLDFIYSGGVITPHLKGTLHLDDADGLCGKVRIQSFNAAGTLLDNSYGGEVCANDDSHHSWSVDLEPYSDDSIASVQVAVEKETASGWYVEASDTYYVNTFPDDVKINASGVDFGSNGFGLSSASGPGSLAWGLNDGDTTPHLTGAIWLNNSGGQCARVNLRYLTEGGSDLTERSGGTVCAPDNGLYGWSVDLNPYTSNKIGKVQVELQTLAANGSYVTAGSQTVSIAQ